MEDQYILRVDLSTGETKREAVPAELLEKYLGGKGLAAHYLMTELAAGADALSPENLLIVMAGPLCGIFPGTTRHVVVTKSPATGGFLDTYAGGFFAWELRKAGLLGMIVTGRAPALSYLEVTEAGAVVRDASHLAGLSTAQVDDHEDFAGQRVLAIGPAGENQVAFAAIGNNTGKTKKGRSGFNGRGGAGAVMGSKNLKAIAVSGGRAPETSAEAKLLRSELSAALTGPDSAAGWLADAGTPAIVDWTNGASVLPTRNWSSGSFEGADKVGHESVIANLVKREGCYNCPVNCGPHVKATEGAFPGAESKKLEYETLGLAASNTGNADFSSIVRFSELCDDLGLDTISAGAAVAFAMDCAERGLIDHPIRFGDSAGQARLTEEMAYRRGLGAELADGIEKAAQAWKIDDSQVPVFSIKNLEFPAYDPRGSVGMALAYATSDRGACHMRSWPIAADALAEEEAADPFAAAGKAAFVTKEQDENSAEWSLVGCDFVAHDAEAACRMLAAVGLEMSVEDYERLGTRIWNLVRLFNLREGWTEADDRLPKAIANPLSDSGRSLPPELFETMKKEYYEVRDWDERGRPSAALLEELGLSGYAAGGLPESAG
jgi:aldehyde:ferredoxin oxidoreductase